MPTASVMGDNAKHDNPPCPAPIHPPAPVPTPVPHPPIPLAITLNCCPTVKIGGKMATLVTSQTVPCSIPPCVPNGPGMVALGSFTVLMTNLPAARVNDMVAFMGCVAPIPSPTGKIIGPGVSTVQIGG